MIYSIHRQTVADYEKWRLVFDEGEAYRKGLPAQLAPAKFTAMWMTPTPSQ